MFQNNNKSNPHTSFSIMLSIVLVLCSTVSISAQEKPTILMESSTEYLPDYSYAGYHNGEKVPYLETRKLLLATDFGVVANDKLDDTKAFQKLLEEAHNSTEAITIILPAGRIIISDFLYIERSNLVIKGAGSGIYGTEIYCPRPMKYFEDPAPFKELREYLVELDKRQREKENNIDLPFSQYAWSGGVFWVKYPGKRVKEYLEKYDEAPVLLSEIEKGKKGEHTINVSSANNLNKGDIIQIEWYNKDGKEGSIIKALYPASQLNIGAHHWNYPDHALIRQRSEILSIAGNKVTIKDPLILDINSYWEPAIVEWKHLSEVGLEHFSVSFPIAPNIAHHVEDGYNAIYLTHLYNGWVRDVKIRNADSGILTEEIANVTIQDIETSGDKIAHYTVAMSGVHNVLVKNLHVKNVARHPLSFNTYSTKSVYLNCKVDQAPILDQHSGVNHQNLFDNIKVSITLKGATSYPLFVGGGAGYWKPSHGAYTTFWNINVHFEDGHHNKVIVLDGMKDGPKARLVGIHADLPIEIEYGPDAYIEMTNKKLLEIPSLYQYQLKKRLDK